MKTNNFETCLYQSFPLRLTPEATEMALAAIQENDGEDGEFLRVSVRGGGCAGLQYSMTFVNDPDVLDIVTEKDGLKIVTDIFSSIHLNGTEVNYVDSLDGAGFKFENPSAKRTCGCGSSFSG